LHIPEYISWYKGGQERCPLFSLAYVEVGGSIGVLGISEIIMPELDKGGLFKSKKVPTERGGGIFWGTPEASGKYG